MICFPLDNTEYEAKDMGAYLGTRTRGVFSAEENLAVSAGAGGLTVTVAPGLAWLKRDEYWGTAALNEAAFSLTLEAADGVLKRMDAVVCRLDKVGNRAELVVKKGSFAEEPAVAAPVRDESYDELYLATVLVDAGATDLSAESITDQRLNEEYCGLMRDGVTGIPTKAMQEQASALFNSLYEQLRGRAEELEQVIEGIVHGSEVMLRAVYDKDADGVVDEAAAVQAYTPSAAQVYAPSPPAGGEGSSAASETFGGPVRLSVDEATGAVKLHAVKQGLDEEGEPVGEESIEEVPVASAQNAAALGGKAESALSVGNSAKLSGKTLAVSVSGTTGTITFK